MAEPTHAAAKEINAVKKGKVKENPMQYSESERHYLDEIWKRIELLRRCLVATPTGESTDLQSLRRCLDSIKKIQGNSSNDMSFVACMMAKEYLAQEFDVSNLDIAAKPQGAPGLDIEFETTDRKKIIAEVKTTVPSIVGKGNFGANQKENIRHDFKKLAEAKADRKFFFGTNDKTCSLCNAMKSEYDPQIEVILLPASEGRHDPSEERQDLIEDDPQLKDAFAAAEREAEAQLAGVPHDIGFCHLFWGTMQEILREKYGIDWKTPAEMNPHICFD